MSFTFGFRSDGDDGGSGGVSAGESGCLRGEGKNERKYWENLGILEGRSLGRNTLEEGAMGHGTPVTSVSLPGASLPRRSGLVLKCRVGDAIQSYPRF